MDVVYYLLALQHPGTLLLIGAVLTLVTLGLIYMAIRIVQYRQWRAEAPQREMEVLASGLSLVGRQGRLPLPSPTVGSRLVGSTPRAASPRPPLGDPRPTSPPSDLLNVPDIVGWPHVVRHCAIVGMFGSCIVVFLMMVHEIVRSVL